MEQGVNDLRKGDRLSHQVPDARSDRIEPEVDAVLQVDNRRFARKVARNLIR